MSLITANRLATDITFPAPPKTADKETLRYIAELHTAIKTFVARTSAAINSSVLVGPIAQQPAAGQAGRYFYSTDTNHLFIDTGSTAWTQLI